MSLRLRALSRERDRLRSTSYRPRLEWMEERTLLSDVSWTGNAHDNNWDTPGNWSTDSLPGMGDDVTINTSADVVHSNNVTDTIKSLTSTGPLTISGGTLSIASAFTTSSTLTITGGTLNDPGAITVGGLLTLSGGTISGLATAGAPSGTGTTTANGGITLNPAGGDFTLDGDTLTNPAGQTATFSGVESGLLEGDGAEFVNDGAFLAQALGNVEEEGTGNPVSFIDNGTFTRSVKTSVFDFTGVAFNVNAPGTVDIQTGILQLFGGGTSTGGAFTVESGATLYFGGSAPFTLDSATTLSGTGTVTEDGAGTVTILGNSPSFTGTTLLGAGLMLVNGSQPASTVNLVSGTLGGSGTVGPITSSGTVGYGLGILTAQGNVTLDPLSNFDISINGANPGTGFTQLVVNGTATLTGSALHGSINGFTPTPGETFPIITSTAPIVGTFNGLPEGATISIRGIPFAISYKGGNGDDVVLTDSAVTTTTTLSSSAPSGSSFGQAVTFTATVAPISGSGSPTGTVTFTIDGTAQTPVPLQVLGNVDQASLPPISSLTIGQHTIGATYSGDDNFVTSTAQSLTQTVNPIATTITLSSSAPSGSSFGQAVTFTAAVAPSSGTGTPTGTVTFTIDGTAQTPVPLQVVGGVDQASLPAISTLSVGSHIIGATYSGDDNFSTSTAQSLTQNVASVIQASTTTLASSVNPSTFGQTVTFTATVTPDARSTDTPTGTVTFEEGTTLLGTAPLNDGVATLAISTLAVGSHTIAAVYSGDADFATASGVTSETVNAPNPPPATSTGPRLTGVQRFGFHAMPTTVVLTFDQPLDPGSAEDVRNYVILDPSGHRIRINRAVLDPTRLTVTLHPAQRISIHHPYQLIVNGAGPGAVSNMSGQPLDSVDAGQPGSSDHLVLTWRQLQLGNVSQAFRNRYHIGSKNPRADSRQGGLAPKTAAPGYIPPRLG
jgi:Bacterial Ig-like domain (group 3)